MPGEQSTEEIKGESTDASCHQRSAPPHVSAAEGERPPLSTPHAPDNDGKQSGLPDNIHDNNVAVEEIERKKMKVNDDVVGRNTDAGNDVGGNVQGTAETRLSSATTAATVAAEEHEAPGVCLQPRSTAVSPSNGSTDDMIHNVKEKETAEKTTTDDGHSGVIRAYYEASSPSRQERGEAQLPANTVSLVPHRVFTKEELKTYMENQRQREREKKEEVRHSKARRNSTVGGVLSRPRGMSAGGGPSMRMPSLDANIIHPSQLPQPPPQVHPFFATASGAAAPLSSLAAGAMSHPLGYHPAYAGAPLPSANIEIPPPPYPNIVDAGSAPNLNNGLHLSLQQQQQQQRQRQSFQQPAAFCTPWGIQGPPPHQAAYMGPPQPCTGPAIFDPAAIMGGIGEQQQCMNDHSLHLMPSAPLGNAAQGGVTGMSMQELEVLARLIVLARNEQQQLQQQQQQQQLFFPNRQQPTQAHQQQQYCYYSVEKQSDVSNLMKSFNPSPQLYNGVKLTPNNSNLHGGAVPGKAMHVLEKDSRIMAMQERREKMHL